MIVEKFTSDIEWFAARRGKITGTRVAKVIPKRNPNEKKVGYYELICEKLGVPADDENPMERGSRLEKEALEKFHIETGKEVDGDRYIWSRDDNQGIAVSPDGVIGEKEAVECKCLDSARHIEAYLTKQIPDEYRMQAIQYFVVNDKLEKLYFVFYDPRFSMFNPPNSGVAKLDFFYLTLTREEAKEEIAQYYEFQLKILKEVDEVVAQLTF